jgi:hypothetical protein
LAFIPANQPRFPVESRGLPARVLCEGWDATALNPRPLARTFCLSHPSQRTRRMGHPIICGWEREKTRAPFNSIPTGQPRKARGPLPRIPRLSRIFSGRSRRSSDAFLRRTGRGSCPACRFRREQGGFPRSLRVFRSRPCDRACNSRLSPPRRLSGCDTDQK